MAGIRNKHSAHRRRALAAAALTLPKAQKSQRKRSSRKPSSKSFRRRRYTEIKQGKITAKDGGRAQTLLI